MFERSFTGKKPPDEISVNAKFSELKDLTERLVTMDSMSKLLHGDTMSEEALRQTGGKTGVTAKYLKAAEDAAKAHTVFVQAVYASKTHAGIQKEVKEKQS